MCSLSEIKGKAKGFPFGIEGKLKETDRRSIITIGRIPRIYKGSSEE